MENVNKSLIILISLLSIILILSNQSRAYIKTKIVINDNNASQWLRQRIEENLTTIIQEVNRAAEENDSLNLTLISNHCLEEGKKSILDIFNETKFYTFKNEFNLPLICIENYSCYEIRGIKVNVELGETKASRLEYLVFTVNNMGLIEELRFATKENIIREIMEHGCADIENRQKILALIEQYRTAYNKKNIDFLEKIFAEDALIIVGLKLGNAPSDDTRIKMKVDDFQYVKRTKKEYLEKLKKNVFPRNAYIKVLFKEIEIKKLLNRDIYGIKVKQWWNSSTYSDSGYVFIMYDFEPPEPVIRVRTFQSAPLAVKKIFGLDDFEIIGKIN